MDYIPPNALIYIPVLKEVMKSKWPDHPMPVLMASKIEQETCISLKYKSCWNPKTELKTQYEYGFGLGQLTITSKFNNFLVVKRMDKDLANWDFEDRYNARKQIIALVVFNKYGYNLVSSTSSSYERLAMSLAAYNGGSGGLNSDRKVCQATPNCDYTKWFGNVEYTSMKSRTARTGYGQSAYDINRGYVTNIMKIRYKKYEQFFN